MRPLRPDEREAILAAHPEATEDDLDAFEELLLRRFRYEPPRAKEIRAEAVSDTEAREAGAPSKVEALDAEIARMQEQLFPDFDEILAQAAERRQTGGGTG